MPNFTPTRRLTSGDFWGALQRILLLIGYPIYRQAARREKVLTIPEGEENRTPGCFLSGITLPPGSRQCSSPPCLETSARSVNQNTRSCDHRTQTFCFSLFCLFPFFGRQIRAVQSSFGTYRLTRYFCVGEPRMVLAVG